MTEPQSAKGLVALIAEDSRIQAKILERSLAQAGYAVQVACDGAEAIELARKQKPNVIISDIDMPRMNGYEFCRAVKQDPALCDVPVVLLSTLSEAVDIIQGLDAGADNYVTKPYDPNYLLARVESLLTVPPAEEEAGTVGELPVTLAGQTYRVKAGRRQVLNLLISTFENAVEQNRELHRLNEQLILAKKKLQLWNTQLESLNEQLDSANQRMSHDLQAAARVQQSLLPTGGLDFPAAQFAWKYTPCEELAGDFLNFFPLDERHIAMYVVDVSGHGAASALLAVAIGRLLTGHASASSLLVRRATETSSLEITPPADVARELNRRFPMDSQDGLYFTMAYGHLDVETKELRYVVAGHPPLIHVPRGARPRNLPGVGFAIGLVDDADYEEQAIALQTGDRLYFYSDGVPEAMNANRDLFSDERMLEVFLVGKRPGKPGSERRALVRGRLRLVRSRRPQRRRLHPGIGNRGREPLNALRARTTHWIARLAACRLAPNEPNRTARFDRPRGRRARVPPAGFGHPNCTALRGFEPRTCDGFDVAKMPHAAGEAYYLSRESTRA
ncbi:MAG TPA: SpoIIE family protein phosphatase [Pirellulales bacterium]|nr:SpoIIE family protein phosphatase [Pirellulales bacterium]